ncbi:MAG TPA: hypothetical protein VGB37_02815, partial [Candidatus Lokiarchaeia archaeon]
MSSTAIEGLFNDYCSHCYHYETSIGVCNEIHENVRSYPKIFIQKCNGNFFKNDITKAVQNKEDFIEENTVKENLTNANESITSAQHIKLVFGHIKDTKYEQDGPYVVAKHNSQVRDYYLTLPDSGSKIENLYCPV